MSTTPEETRPRIGPWSVAWVCTGLSWLLTIVLCLLHGAAVQIGMGGWAGITSAWPPTRHDHPQHFHNARIARPLFQITGTNAGYDPSFMAGYAKSVISDSSSTISDLVVGLFGSRNPALAYKLYVLIASAAVPWLVVAAGLVWRATAGAIAVSVLLFLIYLWTDFPAGFPALGMVAYFLAIPLGLLVTAIVATFLGRGGFRWWLASTIGASLLLLVHVTSPMIVAPAVGLAYTAAVVWSHREGAPFPASRHVGFWSIPILVLAVNAFWWLPALLLAETKGRSDLAFAHPEQVTDRLWAIITNETPVQPLLCAGALVGLPALWRRGRTTTVALGAFLGAGFAWGYLAGWLRALDPLQPGRQTYALYTGAALAAGMGGAEVWSRLRSAGPGRLDRWATVAVLIVGIRMCWPSLSYAYQMKDRDPERVISGPPSARLRRIVSLVEHNVHPGERLLYEEGGAESAGRPDIFSGERGSGLLPYFVPGIELLGGPFLHVTQTTNFTQFGEGKLFEKADWDRDHFVRYARLYRPAAIVCWSPRARAFCKDNPDVVKVLDDDGVVLVGRVLGFEGATIEGTADVEAQPGRLLVRNAVAGKDGALILRYHYVPLLRTNPAVPCEPVYLEADPVPFIRLRPTPGTVSLEVRFGPQPR